MFIPVRCADCGYFINDVIGSGQGVGQCKVLNHYKQQGVQGKDLTVLLRKLGNRAEDGEAFWPGGITDRLCERYKARIYELPRHPRTKGA